MKKLIVTATIVIFQINLFSQSRIAAKLINSIDNKPIEFANIWLADANIGTTSNLNGEFSVQSDSLRSNLTIKISAIGYFDTTISVSRFLNNDLLIKLKEKKYQLSEVVIKPEGKLKDITLNKIKPKNIFVRVVSSNTPRMIANYFPYNENLNNTMLKKVIIHTYRNQQDYLCNIRLYKSENDMPGKELLNRNINFKVKKGSKDVQVDLSEYKLEFPKEGIFVCLEWLIIDQNKRNVILLDPETNEKTNGIHYGPTLAGVADIKPNCWLYYKGKWEKHDNYMGEDHWAEKHRGKYYNLAMTLVILK